MLTVMLVDDEINILQGMEVSIDWAKHGYQIVALASNGREGLEKALELKPDVIIADITMPVMNGIDMVEKIKESIPDIKVIFLTCHEDFDYARQAIRLAAADYISKATMTRDELYIVLEKINRQVIIDKKQREKNILILAELNKNKHVVRASIINEILNNNKNDTARMEERLEVYGDSLKSKNFILSILKLDEFNQLLDSNIFNSIENVKFAVLNIIDEILGNTGIGTGFNKNDNEYVIIYNFDIDLKINIYEKIKLISQDIQSSVNGLVKCDCTIYIGRHFRNLNDITAAYYELRNLEDQRFYLSNNSIVLQTKQVQVSEEAPENCLKSVVDAFEAALKDFDDECTANLIDFLAKTSVKYKIHREEVLDIAKKMFIIMLHHSDFYGFRQENLIPRPFAVIVQDAQNIDSLTNILHYYASKVLRLTREKAPFYISGEIAKVVQYINRNLGENITLESVANYVSMNSSYFSRFFKNKTGENFVDYLVRIRIDKAKELLIKTEMTIDDIAGKVGHINTAYFSKVFKKVTGLTPGEFRRASRVR